MEVEDDDRPCCVCNDADHYEDNLIVFCDGCDQPFHQRNFLFYFCDLFIFFFTVCYGLRVIPEGDWLCDKCSFLTKEKGFELSGIQRYFNSPAQPKTNHEKTISSSNNNVPSAKTSQVLKSSLFPSFVSVDYRYFLSPSGSCCTCRKR